MNIHRLSLTALALAGSLLTGCAGLSVKPPKPSGMPRAEAPVPLKVGIYMKKPRFEWQGTGGMTTAYMESHRDRWMFKSLLAESDDVGSKFVRALQASSAFTQVNEVKSLGFYGTGGEHDLLIDADFSGKYTQDPALFGKAFMTGFLMLLPAPFIRYDDAFFAAAELTVYDRTGRLLHKYSERQDIATSAGLFSAGTPSSIVAGIDAAASNLASKLVTALINDRAGYQRAAAEAPAQAARRPAPTPAPVPAEAVTEPVVEASPLASPMFGGAVAAPATAASPMVAAAEPAAAQPAAAESAPASSEVAEAKPAAKPAARGPLTPAEELEIDEQLMP